MINSSEIYQYHCFTWKKVEAWKRGTCPALAVFCFSFFFFFFLVFVQILSSFYPVFLWTHDFVTVQLLRFFCFCFLVSLFLKSLLKKMYSKVCCDEMDAAVYNIATCTLCGIWPPNVNFLILLSFGHRAPCFPPVICTTKRPCVFGWFLLGIIQGSESEVNRGGVAV